MASLWDIGKSSEEKLADEWKNNDEFEEMVSEHRHKFEEEFRENMNKDVPTHPYKVYRDIVESNELSDEEKVILQHMKDEFSEKWQNLKQGHSN